MPLDPKVTKLMEKALAKVDDLEARSSRLTGDARRLYGRVRKFLDMNLLPDIVDPAPLELACHALQLPLRTMKTLPSGRLGRTNVRDRAEQAAEMLITLMGGQIDDALLDRTTQLLHEMPQKAPLLGEARVLADAVNLEDFGVTGLLLQAIQLCRTGGGVFEIVDGQEKREQYGYWEVRLKEGFHFEPVRQIARKRLEHTHRVTALLLEEMREDRAV